MSRFTPEQIQQLGSILSSERLEHWKTLVAHSNLSAWRMRTGLRLPAENEHAVRLHEWNSTMAASILASLQLFELSLRNHIHAAMTSYYQNENWWGIKKDGNWTPSDLLVGDQAEDVAAAIRRGARRQKGVTSGYIISQMSFGFWLALLGPTYDNPNGNLGHWRNCLSAVFLGKGKVDRKKVFQGLEEIVKLRNMCAHHDPIVTLNLNTEFQKIVFFAGRFSIYTAEWISDTSLVHHLAQSDWLSGLSTAGRLVGSRK